MFAINNSYSALHIQNQVKFKKKGGSLILLLIRLHIISTQFIRT